MKRKQTESSTILLYFLGRYITFKSDNGGNSNKNYHCLLHSIQTKLKINYCEPTSQKSENQQRLKPFSNLKSLQMALFLNSEKQFCMVIDAVN